MFGLATFKIAAIAIFVALVVGYIGFLHLEVGHYKNQAEKYEQAFTAIVHTQATRLAQVEGTVKEQDEARQQQTIKTQQVIDKLVADNATELGRLHEELSKVAISADARRVFNSTGSASGPDQKGPTGQTNASDASGGSTLADLLAANEVNKKNYLECREDKAAWIQLWKETEANLNGTP